jgi:hypothetical protein
VKEKGASALFFVDICFSLFYKVHVTNRGTNMYIANLVVEAVVFGGSFMFAMIAGWKVTVAGQKGK